MLANAIVWEYVLAILIFAFLWVLLPYMLRFMTEKNDSKKSGWEGLGEFFILLMIYFAITAVLSVVFFVVNPIRIMMVFQKEFAQVQEGAKRVGLYALVCAPMPLAAVCILKIWIERFLYQLKYFSGRNAYIVAETAYKEPEQFVSELRERKLYYEEECGRLLADLNRGFDRSKDVIRDDGAYYTPAVMMSFLEEHDDYYTKEQIISPSSDQTAPAYIYNAILLLNEEGELQYVPAGRYMMNGCGRNESEKPFYRDYYVECKILFIDGHVYAIIGSGESNSVGRFFQEYERPFYVLLSEEDRVTTFYDGKYYPDGSIENGYSMCHHLSMHPNTRADKKNNPHRPAHYPVRKVGRIDFDTIQAVAKELRNGILKESADAFLRVEKMAGDN